MHLIHSLICFFFFNDTATTEIYTLSLHDALPISHSHGTGRARDRIASAPAVEHVGKVRRHREVHDAVEIEQGDRKSTRLNSSHLVISYAVFCLKKKKIYPDKLCPIIYPIKTPL